MNPKRIRRHFDRLDLAELKNDFTDKEKISLVFDACHFKREFCLLLFRSESRNVHYDFQDSEKIIYYEEALREINRRYEFSSFTIDGRRGVIKLLENLFPGVPVQLCQFHLVKNVLKYTTKRPKTECGKELKKLILELKTSSGEQFTAKYNSLKKRYEEFLKEKNESKEYVHKSLRSAFNSIKTQLPYLFTFQKFPHLKIEKTTNSCDGYFSHLKAKVNIHRGISSRRKIQLIIKLLSS
ncbi:MAG: transposase [Candidatus Caenarcaniphilales bacterium]|nr:transposase [Candidatus Caenarcaniphilales bacterium]